VKVIGQCVGAAQSDAERYTTAELIEAKGVRGLLRTPGSHGCIRMHNHHLIELFEQVNNGTPVEIVSRCSTIA